MGRKKKPSSQLQSNQRYSSEDKKNGEENRFVNLLHIYTIYKQKFRRISKEEVIALLQSSYKNNQASTELCKSLMKAKQIPSNIVDFEENKGFLSIPRLQPLIALLAERSGYKLKPALVKKLNFFKTPQRFQEKFAQLMVYGFWFLGRVISDSLSSKEQINRGNIFNFSKGDMGFWWAGVRILDWVSYLNKETFDKTATDCYSFVIQDPPLYRFHTNRAVINMNKHPLYFLSEKDWQNYTLTIRTIRHKWVPPEDEIELRDISYVSLTEDISPFSDEYNYSNSDISSMSSEPSINTLASRESID